MRSIERASESYWGSGSTACTLGMCDDMRSIQAYCIGRRFGIGERLYQVSLL